MPIEFLGRPSRDLAVRDRVRQRREPAAPDGGAVRAAERVRRERHAVTIPVAGEELALESRHVDADRALALARAAFEAEIEHLVHALVATASRRQAARPSRAAACWRGRASNALLRA